MHVVPSWIVWRDLMKGIHEGEKESDKVQNKVGGRRNRDKNEARCRKIR